MNDLDKIYYVYAYLDTTKPGNYVYGTYTFLYEPFYIGEGKRNRLMFHLNQAQTKEIIRRGNKHKFYRIKSILLSNTLPKIIKLKEGLTEDEALKEEINIISLVGTSFDKTGPLVNLTKGGETGPKLFGELNPMFNLTGSSHPSSNWKRPEWYLQKQSDSHMGEKNPMFGQYWTEEQKKSHSNKIKMLNNNLSDKEYKLKYCRPKTDETKQKMRIASSGENNGMYGKHHSEETKQKISNLAKLHLSGEKNPMASMWKVIDNNNNEFIIKSLNSYCRERGMCADSLKLAGKQNRKVLDGPAKGWSATRI